MERKMLKNLCYWLLIVIASLISLLVPKESSAATGSNNLISVDWLKTNLSRSDLVLIDASQPNLYAAKHIPGAVPVDLFSFGGRVLAPGEMQRIIQSWGISAGKKVVLYDEGASFMATSLFFDLHYFGYPLTDLFVLDGGLAKWEASGGTVTKEPTAKPAPGSFQVGAVNEAMRIRLPEFLVASGDPAKQVLVEGLDAEYYYGGAKFFTLGGHVPNAISLPSKDLFNTDKTFKSPALLQKQLTLLGITPDKQIATYCGGGVAASLPYFVAKFMLGYPEVKLYKESQREWLRDDRGLPFWTFANPNLIRDRQWVTGWNNAMMRAFGVAQLNIVDVRPPEAFQTGYVPFSINLPMSVLAQHRNNPQAFAQQLSSAGVVAAHEVVIVSDGGINPSSALALVMLQASGHPRVSLLSGSVDDWALAGLPLEKKPLAPSRPTRYNTVSAAGVIVDKLGKPGEFPQIVISSGKTLPRALPLGLSSNKVVHLPYTDLIEANGQPKAANVIATALEKAGVSRYAEIICIADETGEAAVNYLLLKMMGFPDVKVLARSS
jgi:thiosulfate/3-mercaptopyruvate sulfurtransferase